MATAFGILCGAYGQDEYLRSGDWLLSPTARLVMLPAQIKGKGGSPDYDKVVVGYLQCFAHLIDEVRRAAKGADVSVEFKHLAYEDETDAPHDFDKTHEVLSRTLREVCSETKDGVVYLHVNSGTFVQQLTLYKFADRQLLTRPVRLLQTFQDPRMPGSIGYKIPRLGLYLHRPPKERNERIAEVRNRIVDLFGEGNESFAKELITLVDVGVLTDEPILLRGGPGSGKTFLAYLIHEEWSKVHHPGEDHTAKFHEVNCAALRGELSYSELFGYEKGAFTGAYRKHEGKLKLADKGTLFLDEVGDLPLDVQGLLLKAIEEKKFSPLGSETKPIESDFRLICATNRDLSKAIQAGDFRYDLYSRISRWQFTLPDVASRTDTVRSVKRFLEIWFDKARKAKTLDLGEYRKGIDLSTDAWAKLKDLVCGKDAKWPGNMRELKDFVFRLCIRAYLKQEREISKTTLEEEWRSLVEQWRTLQVAPNADQVYDDLRIVVSNLFPERDFVEGTEMFLRKEALRRKNNNMAAAAREIYEKPGESLKNPSEKFRSRGKALKHNV